MFRRGFDLFVLGFFGVFSRRVDFRVFFGFGELFFVVGEVSVVRGCSCCRGFIFFLCACVLNVSGLNLFFALVVCRFFFFYSGCRFSRGFVFLESWVWEDFSVVRCCLVGFVSF